MFFDCPIVFLTHQKHTLSYPGLSDLNSCYHIKARKNMNRLRIRINLSDIFTDTRGNGFVLCVSKLKGNW